MPLSAPKIAAIFAICSCDAHRGRKNSLRFLRQDKAMLHCDLRVQWRIASDLQVPSPNPILSLGILARSGSWQNRCYADFYFWAARFFREISRRILFSSSLREKSAQKNPPGKSPTRSSKIYTTKSPTHCCRGAAPRNLRSWPPPSSSVLWFQVLGDAEGCRIPWVINRRKTKGQQLKHSCTV